MKRTIDIVVTMLLLIFLSPLLLLVFLGYLVTGNFPLMFFQNRIGKNGSTFTMIKLRTLSTDTKKTLKDRQFTLGNLMRMTSMDELPQLYNVLKGEMSLIGPRPLPVEYLPLLNDQQHLRHSSLPGITGWTQVNGRHAISWEEKFERDLYYVHNLSFWLDLKIALMTIIVLLSFKKDISLEEKPFPGS